MQFYFRLFFLVFMLKVISLFYYNKKKVKHCFSTLEYGQVVRQWTLNPRCKGSIPFTPVATLR